MEEEENFDFDAPRIKDFSSAKYQRKKKRIEMLLLGKKPKQKMIAAPRKTIFSDVLPDAPREEEEDPEESIDDGWFEEREQAIQEGSSEGRMYLDPGLFAEDGEEGPILERLKITETPQIKQIVRGPSIDLTPIKKTDFGEFTDSPRMGRSSEYL